MAGWGAESGPRHCALVFCLLTVPNKEEEARLCTVGWQKAGYSIRPQALSVLT